MAINFFFEEIKPQKEFNKSLIRPVIKKILADFYFKCGNINFVFTTDEYLLQINKEFLNHDYFTDIITFPDYNDKLVNGDVFISVPRVAENAEKYKVKFIDELHRVIIHGSLHLCGKRDHSSKLRKEMTQLEDFYLNLLLNQNS